MDTVLTTLREQDGVSDVRRDAERISLHAVDSDAAALTLLTAGAHDLEVAAPTLETAFTALTED